MKKLLITLLLISPFSFADWGDVYYCQETTHSTVTVWGERTDKKLGKFTFKLDKEKQAMVFSKDGSMGGLTIKVEDKDKYAPEQWFGETPLTRVHFINSSVLFSLIIPIDITTVTANCDKF